MASEKSVFSSKIGVVAATVGSAVGLGNIWRFPAEAQANGGAAFLFVYILCVFILGIPVMLAETSLGRAGRSDSVGNFRNLTPGSRWWIAGTIGLVASYLILSYYMVVAGWTIEYLYDSITGSLYDGYSGNQADGSVFFTSKMSDYISTAFNPLLWTYIMILINLVVLLKGVNKGIEKMSNLLMPLLFLLLVILCVASLSLPGAIEGVKYFVMPDFSKITLNVVVDALGQAFFSLSLGMGILVTYAAYYPTSTNLGRTAVTVSMLDFMMAFIMGLIIFPAVMSFGIGGSESQLEGTTLVFVTLPEIFANMGGTRLWSTLFFTLLAVAALTSTISIAEVSVAFVRDRFSMSRTKACLVVMLPIFVTSALSSLSLGAVPSIRIAGLSLFDFLDNVATNILLPLSALAICIYVGWVLPRGFIREQLTNHGQLAGRMAAPVATLIRYVCPLLIAGILVAKIISMM